MNNTLKKLALLSLGVFGIGAMGKAFEIKKSIAGLQIMPVSFAKINLQGANLKGALDLLVINQSEVAYNLIIKNVRLIQNNKVLANTTFSGQPIKIAAKSKEVVQNILFSISLGSVLNHLQEIFGEKKIAGEIVIEVAGKDVVVPFAFDLEK